jgi:hypothetical protein
MKYLIVLIVAISFLLGCKADEFALLLPENEDKEKISLADSFVNDYFKSINSSGSYDFRFDGTIEFSKSFTKDTQMETYSRLMDEIGNFQSVEYLETWVPITERTMDIIRFKGKFSKIIKKDVEIRVVIDNKNKIAGFWVKPWKDNLNQY